MLSIEQLALALTVVLAGSLAVLLLGTQILEWYWLAAFAAVGLGFAAYRVRKRFLSPYRVAQVVDRRLSLSDSLSTAWFLTTQSEHSNPAVASFEIGRADALAATIEPASAFPFTGLRPWLLTGALAVAALSLFGVRYLVTDSLSLRPALVPLNFSVVFETLAKPFTAEKRSLPPLADTDGQNTALSQSGKSETQHPDSAPAGSSDESASQSASATSRSQNNPASSDQTGANQSREKQSDTRGDASSSNQNVADQAIPKTSETKEASAKDANSSQQQASSGLMDKMKDALNSLMSKMRPNSSAQNSQQGNGRSPQQQSNSAQNTSNPGQQQAQNGQRQASDEQSSQSDAPGQTAEKSQSSGAHGSDQTPAKDSSEARSGIGRQDGQKDLKEAQQLQAMGKLAEIIGKRSANVSGEITLETPSGKQRLQTDYSARVGRHADLGGEINRNEIPLMYQQYVRDYMDQVHKQAAAATNR